MTRKLSFVQPKSRRDASPFRQTVRHEIRAHRQLWSDTPAAPVEPATGEYTPRQQRRNERDADRLLDELERQLRRFPESERARPAWREAIRAKLEQFGRESLAYPEAHCAILFDPEFFRVTRVFVRGARAFDETVEIECLFQALRNVWIMNSIQMFLNLPVACSPPVFAYSMLYPYTDNYLDDPLVPVRDKREFNAILGRRLSGHAVAPNSDRMCDVFRLVAMIENEYPRDAFRNVYESLLAIHRGQVLSLEQQAVRAMTPGDVLDVSLEKGGTSVLAHGYLVQGSLTAREASFLFGYGVFLQLMDDMQDAVRDHRHGHTTLFSGGAEAPLDRLASRLMNFTHRALHRPAAPPSPQRRELAGVIERNCLFLVQQAVAVNQHLYSANFAAMLEKSSPVRFEFLRRRKNAVRVKYDRVRRYLRAHRGVRSVLEVV